MEWFRFSENMIGLLLNYLLDSRGGVKRSKASSGWIPGSPIGFVLGFKQGSMAFHIEKPRVLLDQTRDFIEVYSEIIRVYFNGIGMEIVRVYYL